MPEHTWEDQQNFLDDTSYSAEEAQQFKTLLGGADESGAGKKSTLAGSLLNGRIVEISKDYAVVDVGLKSEGLVPIDEFADPAELELGTEARILGVRLQRLTHPLKTGDDCHSPLL